MLNNRLSWNSLPLGLMLLGLALPVSASMNVELLRADFNDKPLNTQIGTGGASVGEPVSLSPGLLALVQATPLSTPSLHLGEFASGEKDARFEFIGAEGIYSGELRIRFTIRTPSALDNFRVIISEQGGNASSFGGVRLRSNGNISTIDANPTATLRTWSPNETLHFELVYQVAAGTYDLFINGEQELDDRAHGDPLIENGIGAVSFGFPEQPGALEWVIDDIHVDRTPALLNADFDDKSIGVQIGTGGPAVGEPVGLTGSLIAVVESGHFSTPALRLEQATTGMFRPANFELMNERSVASGELRISFRILTAPIDDQMSVSIKAALPDNSAFNGLNVSYGKIVATNIASNPVVGNYMPGDEIFFEFRYAMESGTYDLYINRVLVLDDQPHNLGVNESGIARLSIGPTNLTTSWWVLDDLYVYQPDVLFQDGFD